MTGGRWPAVLVAAGAVALAAAGAGADGPVLLGNPDAVALTVYNTDLALVRETRAVRLPAGKTLVRLEGVPEALEPRSVQTGFASGRAVADVLGQTYRADLLGAGRLLEGWIGRQLTLVRDLPDGAEQRTEATLLTTEGGLVFRTDDAILLGHPGRVELPDSAAVETGLTVRPALDWQVDAPAAGTYTADVRYLTGGLGWTTDYVATLSEDEKALALSAWVTVDNRSSRAFDGATLRLVAGRVNRVGGPPQPRLARMQMMEAEAMDMAFEENALFEYHLYTLDRPVTLPARSLHQVSLYEAAAVPVERQYVVRSSGPHAIPVGGGEPGRPPVEVRLAFDNTADAGLGRPLPAGVVRVYSAGPGAEQFLGEERLQHTPSDETITLTVGRAFDLVAERVQTDYEDRGVRGRRSYEAGFRVTLRNRKKDDVVIQVRETIPGDWTVLEKSHPVERLDATTAAFSVPVPAGGEAVLSYRVSVD